LNFLSNESYISFRRREIKAVRKTRASQTTSSDKLLCLQNELAQGLELAKTLLARENLKRDCTQQSLHVWDKRLEFAELKCKFLASSMQLWSVILRAKRNGTTGTKM